MSDRQEHRPRVLVRGTGLLWGFVLALPLAAALIVFIAQNTQQVTVHWTVWKVHTSLVVVVLVTIFAAVLLAEIVGVVWRHRRRRLLARHERLSAELAGRTAPEPEPGPGAEPQPEPAPALDAPPSDGEPNAAASEAPPP